MPTPSTLNGETISVTKYQGGDFDGYNTIAGVLSLLDGTTIEITKYHGCDYDGYDLQEGILTQLNGTSIEIVKYQGGSYDGFSNDESDILYLDGVIYLTRAPVHEFELKIQPANANGNFSAAKGSELPFLGLFIFPRFNIPLNLGSSALTSGG